MERNKKKSEAQVWKLHLQAYSAYLDSWCTGVVLLRSGDLQGSFARCSTTDLCLNQVGGAKRGGRQEQVKLAEREDVVWQAGEDLRMKKDRGDMQI